MGKGSKLLFLLAVIALAVMQFSSHALADAPLIYVSGAPDCYPIEYYDSDSREYRGYIPQLLSRFGTEYGYNIEYLGGDSDSRRGDLKNSQAEIVSAASADDFSAEELEGGLRVFSADKEYLLLFTAASGDTLKAQLTEFFSGITAEQSNAVLLSVTGGRPRSVSIVAIVAVVLAIALLSAAVVVLAIRLKKCRETIASKDTDIITGLGNYLYMERYFKQLLNDKNRSLYSAVYFGAYLRDGREDQNEYLKTLAVILNGEIGDTDILARIDDGFFVLKNLSEKDMVCGWVEDTLNKINLRLKEKKEFSSAIITGGIYTLGTYDRDLERMISNTAYCCRYARKNKLLYSVYSRAIERAEKEEDQLREDIKSAFEKDEFTAYLQFFVNAQNGNILGAEALSRWNHPTMGVLSPGKYIELLEEEHLIQELDFAILRKACETLEEVCTATKRAFFIAFNFSRNTLVLPDFVDRLEQIVSQCHFPRECLLLEVTEYTRVSDNQTMYGNIKRIKKLGIKVVIDDFGSGFTDLIDIGKGEFDGVKLDKSLVDGEHTAADDIILKSLIGMMHELGMTVIAEGIEREEQAARLLGAGCNVIQGYLYYLPMPKREALRVLISGLSQKGE